MKNNSSSQKICRFTNLVFLRIIAANRSFVSKQTPVMSAYKSVLAISLRLLILALMVSCGGSGTSSSTSAGVRMKGVFIDSPVEGLYYSAGNESGFTDSSGTFYYANGSQVTFSIGEIQLPAVAAAEIVTPLSMSKTGVISDNVVANVAYLLQALDSDRNPVNGISITKATSDAATKQLDFSVDPLTFQSNKDVLKLIKDTNGSFGSTINSDSSVSHLAESLRGLLDSGAIIGPTGCQTDISKYKSSTSIGVNLWASFYLVPKDGQFYDGLYLPRSSNDPNGNLIFYSPEKDSIEVESAKQTQDWSDDYSLKYDKWFRHSNNSHVVIRIAAKMNGPESTYRPMYSGVSIYLHYANPRGGALAIEMSPGSDSTVFFSFIGNNKGTVVKTPTNYPLGFMHFGGTTPDGRSLGATTCVIQSGGSVMLWQRPTARTDLFYSPEFKSDVSGVDMPVIKKFIDDTTKEEFTAYPASAGIRSGVRSLKVLF